MPVTTTLSFHSLPLPPSQCCSQRIPTSPPLRHVLYPRIYPMPTWDKLTFELRTGPHTTRHIPPAFSPPPKPHRQLICRTDLKKDETPDRIPPPAGVENEIHLGISFLTAIFCDREASRLHPSLENVTAYGWRAGSGLFSISEP